MNVNHTSHKSKALSRCCTELERFISEAKNYDLDEMAVQSLRTAIDCMQEIMNVKASPKCDYPECISCCEKVDGYCHKECHPDKPVAQSEAGTPLSRLNWMFDELDKRFPECVDMFCSQPLEPKYITEIDKLIAAEHYTVPDGWVLVPRKLTDEMMEAVYNSPIVVEGSVVGNTFIRKEHHDQRYISDAWEAMLEAVPQPPQD